MRRQHTGRPDATPIHPAYTDTARTLAATSHTAACEIRRPGGITGGFDNATGRRATTPNAPHWAGPCAITTRTTSGAGTSPKAGGEVVPEMTYLIALDADTAPQTHTGDVVVITSTGLHGDASLIGRPYVVEFIGRDSITAERLLYCTENQS